MMMVYLNDQEFFIAKHSTLREFLEDQGYTSINFAVALNQCFIKKINYDHVILNHHDRVDIIRPMQGG